MEQNELFARYLIPLAPFLLIAINSVLGLFFFLTLGHELRITNLRLRRRQSVQESATEGLKTEIAELRSRMRETEERAGVLVPPAPPRSGLNLNKRTQVIRMSRRGEQVEKIAASLNLPRREVELLLKVHGQLVYNSREIPAGTVKAEAAGSTAAVPAGS
jgi:hypothetical protein